MSCFETTTAPVCATDADGVRTTLVAHYVYGLNAEGKTILESTVFTDAAGAAVDTADLKVSVGACPIASPDVEFTVLCDVNADGVATEFMCRTITSFNSAGLPIVPAAVAYFEMDKVTVYEPVGTIKPCPDCPPAVALGVLTAWGA